MKKFLYLFFLLPQVIHSQNLNWEINVAKGIGTFIPHTPKIRHLLSNYENPISISLFNRNQNTEVFLHYFPAQNHVIGSQWALTPTHVYPIIHSSKFQWNWLGGAGIARIENPFHQEYNPKNIAIGSKWNVSILTGFQSKFQINDWTIGSEIFAQHASNGSFKKPNLGLNYLNFYFMVGKSFSNPTKIQLKSPRNTFPSTSWYSTFCAFANQDNLPGGPTSLVLSSQTGWMKMISEKRFLTGGMDFFADGSNQKTLSEITGQPLSKLKTSQLGIQFGYGFWGNQQLAAFVQQGFYLYSFQNLEGKLYQRIGIRRKLNDQLQFTASLKTHFAQADHLEFGVLYLWKS